jgi:hypothetical protein
MNVDVILSALNSEQVDYILVGGMNFLIRHLPELTFDVDIWVRDSDSNLERLNRALRQLGAQWGPTEQEWAAVPEDWRWLQRQMVFCLTTDHGALDVFRELRGLENQYETCRTAASLIHTASGIPFMSLSDEHMLACQEALPVEERHLKRMEVLREAIRKRKGA